MLQRLTEFRVDRDGVALVTMNDPDRGVNITSTALVAELAAAFERVAADATILGAVLTSGKERCFAAGGDIKDFAFAHDRGMSLGEAFDLSNDWNVALRRIETCGKPIAAAVNGFALGGGLELALCCHHRVLVDDPRAIVGLPEVTLGLLPAGGGTQRLPRLIGIAKALALMLEGRRIQPAEALELGIVHELAPRERLLETARRWVLAHPDARQPWDIEGFRIPGGEGGALIAAAAQSMEGSEAHYPAPRALLAAVRDGTALPIEAGLRMESRYFAPLLTGPVARNLMRTTFVSKGLADKLARRPEGVPKSKIRKLGVLGDGAMGEDIARVSAAAGIDVVSLEPGDDRAADREGCDLVVEALAESREVTKRAERCIGVHFSAPVERLSLVEIVVGQRTRREDLARGLDFVEQLRKTPIVVKDRPGFYVDRVRAAFRDEAVRMVKEGIAPALVRDAARRAGLSGNDLAGLAEHYVPRREPPDAWESKRRLLYIQALEGARCLEEGVVSHPADADLGAVLGAGFPAWTGGTLSLIETVGLGRFVAQCEQLARRHGLRFRPPPGLLARAARREGFYASLASYA